MRTLAHPHPALLAAFLALAACGDTSTSDNDQDASRPAVTVERVEAVERLEVPSRYAGRTRGVRTVEVRARVDGILLERTYAEGALVEEGDALFVIDPEPYEIALRRARATRQDAQANLAQAQRDWRRAQELHEGGTISGRERDDARSTLELAEARLENAEAEVADARRNLRYTGVTAPVAGVTGLETVSVGNLLSRGDLLTTVTQVDPIHVRFPLPEADARRLRDLARDEGASQRPARLLREDGEYAEEGYVNFTDAVVDARTGTVTARAVFPNPDAEVAPGEFVRVQLVLHELEQAFLVPELAIRESRDGPAVFVIDEDGVAENRVVEPGPRIGNRRAVLSGLEDGDRIVVNGQVAVRDGERVRVTRESERGAN